MSAMASQITSVSIVCSTVCSGADKRNIKAPCHWPLSGESTGDWWSFLTRGRWGGICFHLMTPHMMFTRHCPYLQSWWTSYACHDDVIKWKHFPRYWSFVRGIHRSPVNSPHKRPVMRSFHVFFDLRLNKPLSKQSWGWWFETLSHPLWRHCIGYPPTPNPPTPALRLWQSPNGLSATIHSISNVILDFLIGILAFFV